MRLINTRDLSQFKLFWGLERPAYAILSHTWEDDEVSLQEMLNQSPTLTAKKGYRKVHDFCRVAAEQGYEWAWADTCCIDKTNLAELTESINSMFRWYQEAAVCSVFLADLLAGGNLEEDLASCRWFTRGWTLQELLAPESVEFYDVEWNRRGAKGDLISELESITGIRHEVLAGLVPLPAVCVGTRMSWAASRETTRPEDVAYCLLGIFNVNMPLIYGEGKQAFRRLQEEIIRQSNDLTTLAWAHLGYPEVDNASTTWNLGHLPSPSEFAIHLHGLADGSLWRPGSKKTCEWIDLTPEYAMANKSLRVKITLLVLQQEERDGETGNFVGPAYVLAVGELWGLNDTSIHALPDILAIGLDKIGPDFFARRREPLTRIPGDALRSPSAIVKTPVMDFYIRTGDGQSRLWDWSSVQGIMSNKDLCPSGLLLPPRRLNPMLKAIPESHWDRINRRFFRIPHGCLIFAFLHLLRLDSRVVRLVCLVDQSGVFPLVYLSTTPNIRHCTNGC